MAETLTKSVLMSNIACEIHLNINPLPTEEHDTGTEAVQKLTKSIETRVLGNLEVRNAEPNSSEVLNVAYASLTGLVWSTSYIA